MWRVRWTIKHDHFEGFELSARGLEDRDAAFSFRRGGTWYTYAGNTASLVRSLSRGGSGWVKASADGYLPRVQRVPRDSVFDFGDAVTMKLRVRDEDGTPIPGAWIDVCLPQDDGRSELPVASYRADLGSANRFPASRVRIVGSRPAAPTRALTTTSTPSPAANSSSASRPVFQRVAGVTGKGPSASHPERIATRGWNRLTWSNRALTER